MQKLKDFNHPAENLTLNCSLKVGRPHFKFIIFYFIILDTLLSLLGNMGRLTTETSMKLHVLLKLVKA